MDQQELNAILEKHKLWLDGAAGGECADLRGINLRGSNLRGSDLRGSDLRFSDLRGSNLSFSNLSHSDLSFSDLSGINLCGSNLRVSNLSFSDLSHSDLSFSDLSRSDLRGSDLSRSHLWGAVGNMQEVKSLFLDTYPIVYTADYLQIGCERHLIAEWLDFDDERIIQMGGKTALKWWRKWKDTVFHIIEMSPAMPTG